MEWVETTGKTIEEAKDAALDRLGVDEQDAEFEVVDEGKMGLFGRVRSEARVRARVRPTTPRAKEDRRDRRRRGEGKSGGDKPKGRKPAGAKKDGDPKGDAGGESGEAPAQPKRAAEPRNKRKPTDNGNGGQKMDDVEVPMAEQSQLAEEFLRGLLATFDASADVARHEIDEDTVELQVTGEDLALLIGPKGSTLSAVQEITRTVVQRKTGARNGRLLVDVAGYRAKRREALARFTQEVADRVLDSGEATSLDPMSPADRKVVHDTINGIDGLVTSSQGEEPRRRVVISPA